MCMELQLQLNESTKMIYVCFCIAICLRISVGKTIFSHWEIRVVSQISFFRCAAVVETIIYTWSTTFHLAGIPVKCLLDCLRYKDVISLNIKLQHKAEVCHLRQKMKKIWINFTGRLHSETLVVICELYKFSGAVFFFYCW